MTGDVLEMEFNEPPVKDLGTAKQPERQNGRTQKQNPQMCLFEGKFFKYFDLIIRYLFICFSWAIIGANL